MDRVLKHSYTTAICSDPPRPQPVPEVSGFVRTVNNVLTNSEANAIIDIAETQGFAAASLHTDPHGKEHYSDIRKSKRTIIDSRPFVDELWKRIAHAVPTSWNGRPLHYAKDAKSPLNERLRLLKYDTPGDEFQPHSDGQYASPDGGISELTILLYLNVGYTGAYTHFLADDGGTFIPITPTIGRATIQDQRLVHSVPQLISGTKYVIRTEVMYQRTARS
jgi:prolyl 4-hydroxylase